MKIKKQRISLLIGENMWREFKLLCEERERTPSSQIRDLIHDMIIRDGLWKKANRTANA